VTASSIGRRPTRSDSHAMPTSAGIRSAMLMVLMVSGGQDLQFVSSGNEFKATDRSYAYDYTIRPLQ
jgi:hypothetical protein